MKLTVWASVLIFGLFGPAPLARAQQSLPPAMESLARSGTIRVAVFPPQYAHDKVTNAVQGWPVELAQALATRLHIKPEIVEYAGPRETMEGLKMGVCDLAFLPIEPSWAADVAFSLPLMQIDFTLLVPASADIHSVSAIDQAGRRIAVVNKHASTLALARILKHAELVGRDSPVAAFELLRSGEADALASVRPALLEFAAKLPGSSVLKDRYGANVLTVAVARAQSGRLAYLNEFVETAKESGLVQRALDAAGWRGVEVAQRAHEPSR